MVRFIEYTGGFPNLCTGILVLEVDGEIYEFGCHPDLFMPFWDSGGSCICRDGEELVRRRAWTVDINVLPEELKKYADEIERVFNENVEPGCCGGCI